LHGNVESLGILSASGSRSRKRDSVILAFRDAKISVLEYDDSIHALRTSSMHCFEGPVWFYLKRGWESFPRGPLVKADPQGRCGGVLVYDLQMVILQTVQAGYGLVGDEESFSSGASVSARVDSSYIINLQDLDIKHAKDFIFVHGYIEPVLVVLHERELTWAGRISWKHHTCAVSALSINTTMKQHPIIWSAGNLPHDSYKLLAVPAPIGGVLVICANTIHYHSQSSSYALALNNFAVSGDSRVVQRLDLAKSKASVLASGITTLGNSLFFLASRLGDSLLVQFTSGSTSSSSTLKEEVGDIESDIPSSKRLRRSSSEVLMDMASDELSFYGSTPNKSDLMQKSFSYTVRDSLTNVGPLSVLIYMLKF
ncbi:Cleavage and polyadenylation specificity factor subunit 1-like protein, partial [Drosera capensis]